MAEVGQQQPHKLSLATLRQGPFISATTHTVLKLGQRPLPGAFVSHLVSICKSGGLDEGSSWLEKLDHSLAHGRVRAQCFGERHLDAAGGITM